MAPTTWLRRLLLAAAVSVAPAAADTATTYTMQSLPPWQARFIMSLQLTVPGSPVVPALNVVPLTAHLGLNQSGTSQGVRVFVVRQTRGRKPVRRRRC